MSFVISDKHKFVISVYELENMKVNTFLMAFNYKKYKAKYESSFNDQVAKIKENSRALVRELESIKDNSVVEFLSSVIDSKLFIQENIDRLRKLDEERLNGEYKYPTTVPLEYFSKCLNSLIYYEAMYSKRLDL